MAHNPTYKRTKMQREKDRLFIIEKTLKGYSQAQIASELGISQQQVNKDLRKVLDGWKTTRHEYAEELHMIELRKCDLIEREAWAGWERSCSEGKRRIVKATGRSDSEKEKPQSIEQTTQTMQRDGDPQFLLTVIQSMNRRAKLIGLDRPQKFEQSGSITINENLKSEDLLKEIRALEIELATQEERTS